MADPVDTQVTWGSVRQAFTRPYRVTLPMVVLVGMVPIYLLLAARARETVHYAPMLPLDRLIPLIPAWSLVYGALYAFLIVLPVIVVQQDDMIRRTVWAYLTVWTSSYVVFLLYPTVAPRPDAAPGDGFAAWGLRFLYEADPPYNCFPSLHVAHSFVSALACHRLHRRLGEIALACASLVALSTLFTRQHYVLDVIAGVLLALAASHLFLRDHRRESTPEHHTRLAPALALCVGGIIGLGFACFWAAYHLSGRS